MFEQFLREKRYLNNVSPNTIDFYQYAYNAYKRTIGTEINNQNLKEFVIKLKEAGLATTSINCYIRGINSYLTWLFENEHTTEHLKIKQLQEEKVIITPFTDSQLQALISYKPKAPSWTRLHTLLCLLIDTGLRIDEALTLTRDRIDMDNLVLKVTGKGRKERIVPFSLELRRRLYNQLKTNKFDLVFCNKYGAKLTQRNLLRDFKIIGRDLGIEGVRVSFHTLRHTFAYNYIKSGGNVLYLQRILGHEDLSITKRYVNLQTEDLSLMHKKVSLLERLR